MKIGISILTLFLLFLWIDIITSQQIIHLKYNALKTKDDLLFYIAKKIQNLSEIKYDSIIYFIKQYNIRSVSLYNKDKQLIFAIGEEVIKPKLFPDSVKFFGFRNIGYNTKDKYIFINASLDEIKVLNRLFVVSIVLKIFFYINFFIMTFFALKSDRKKRIEEKKSTEIYIIESLKERIKALSDENKNLKKFKEEIEAQKYLFEIGKNLTTILHEIRNSSGTIIGYSKLLKDKDIGSRILDEALSLNRISDSLLFLSKPIFLKKENVNLYSLLSSIYIPERISYKINCKKNIYVYVDKDLFKKAIENILQNSINAIEDNGEIKITVKKNEKIEIRIEDNGKGMDEEELSRCFEMFYFSDNKGTGIGLWLVKKIIEAHNGEIKIFSVKEKGTTFKIII